MTKDKFSGTVEDDVDSPLYTRIQMELRDRIASGQYQVGTLMPTEIALVTEFNTSRFTVRAALRQLKEAGYVERRQGMGTRVLSANPHTGYVQSFDSLQELFQIAVDTYMVILSDKMVTLDMDLARRIGGEEGSVRAGERWVRIEGVRWTAPGGQPLCYIQSYVPEQYAELVPEFGSYSGPFFDLLESRSRKPILEVQQEIRSLPMPVEMSGAMGHSEGTLSLQLLRRYLTKQGVLIASFNWHPANQMVYRTRVRRQHTKD